MSPDTSADGHGKSLLAATCMSTLDSSVKSGKSARLPADPPRHSARDDTVIDSEEPVQLLRIEAPTDSDARVSCHDAAAWCIANIDA